MKATESRQMAVDKTAVRPTFHRLCRVLPLVAFFISATWTLAEDPPIPTFEKTRPKGDRKFFAPLPAEKPSVPEVRMGVFRPYNPIDNFILTALKENKKRPKRQCNDWDFARRASLDLLGVIPTAADIADRYLKWKKDERRGKWVDLLLAQQQYADHWTTFWGDLLREKGRIRGAPRNALKNYIHKCLQENRPYDRWVREMLASEGQPMKKPETAFILRDRADAADLTVTVTQTFLGMQLKCAQCHDHPFDWWTKDEFDGMAAFWRGTQARAYKRETVFRRGNKINNPFLEVRSRQKKGKGTFLTGVTSDQGRGTRGLADLVTRRDNPFFARVAVNRLWKKMMGIGLVNPQDNFSPRNKPSHPELLDWLAMEFIEHNYDLKHILRLIANSMTYQQTTTEHLARIGRRRTEATDQADIGQGALYNGMLLRRMSAEQIHDSILVATGRYLADNRRFTPSIQVTYPPAPRSFLRAFGCTDRETLQERNTAGGIQQALTLLNGDLINDAVMMHQDHPIEYWRKQRRFNTNQTVEALFVQVLTRQPTQRERAMALRFLAGGQRDSSWEDLQWALLNTREFQFIR
ncbi:MAG: DUF1549 and DUF1553 domain-containing protein [Planctomycetota bacterium]|nr:DUF1549 and DUF1553 domain-containing protein [Planctomycetota bacterium]